MAPLGLTDDAANILLGEWQTDATLSLVAPALLFGQLHHPGIDISDLWLESDASKTACDRARRLRYYVEALRVVSCCRGLDPQQNPGFWREYFTACGAPPSHRITRQLFSNFHVVWDANTDPVGVAAAVWRLISPSTTTEYEATQQLIERRLEQFLERTPSSLQLQLCIRTDCVRWSTITQALMHLQHLTRDASNESNIQQIRIVIGDSKQLKYVGPGDEDAYLIDIIRMPRMVLEELHMRLDTPNAEEISSLMRELVRVDTVKVLSLEFECEAHVVGAVFSSLPSMKTLSALQLDCHHYHSDTEEEACRLGPWLAYALIRRKLRGLPVAFGFQPSPTVVNDLKAAYRQKNCLEGIVSAAVFTEETIVFYGNGVTAELSQVANVASRQANVEGTAVLASQRVAVIARHGSTATVVTPSLGLMTTEFGNLRAWDRPSQKVSVHAERFCVDALICSHSEPTEVTKTRQLFGSSLTSLALRSCSAIQADVLAKTLPLCPQLAKLIVVDGTIDTLQPLLAAHTTHRTRLKTLVYSPWRRRAQSDEASGSIVRQCVDALATQSHPISEFLQELCVERIILSDVLMRDLMLAVRAKNQLNFLKVLWLDDGDEVNRLEEKPQPKELVDQPLHQDEVSQNALYTFLSVVRRKRVLRELPVSCLETVARFAAMPVLRHFSWE